MRTAMRTLIAAPIVGLLAIVPFSVPAYGDTGDGTQTQLDALNSSGVSGNAEVWVDGMMLHVEINATGLLADQPHAAHIHFGEDARNECPTMDEAGDDDMLDTSEGEPAYGPIVVSLTTEGDTSPDSGLAVDRFNTAPGGTLTYKRGSIEVSQEIAQAVRDGRAAVVVHGVDYNDNGEYDADAGMSDLDPALPREATDPNSCGLLTAMPAGGAAAGAGGTAGGLDMGLLGAGLLALAGGAVLAVRRFATR